MGTKSDDRRKLLVLDINGLLLYRASDRKGKELSAVPGPPDRKVGSFYVWDRPHQQAFVEFCFKHFDVAVWSSAKAQNVEKLVSYVFGANCSRLKFQWDQNMCDNTGRRHPDNKHRPIFHKDLKKIWSDADLGRTYNAFNTLLIDDDKYKAELTPQNAIHPHAWTPDVVGDQDLEEGGKLQKLLEDLLKYDTVPEFVSVVAKTDVAFAGVELQTRPANMQRHDTHQSSTYRNSPNGSQGIRQHQGFNGPRPNNNNNNKPRQLGPYYGSDQSNWRDRMQESSNRDHDGTRYDPAQYASPGSFERSRNESERSILGEYPVHGLLGSYSGRSDYRQPGWSGPNLGHLPGPYDPRRANNRDLPGPYDPRRANKHDYDSRRDRDRNFSRTDEAFLNSRQNDYRGNYARPTQQGQRDRRKYC